MYKSSINSTLNNIQETKTGKWSKLDLNNATQVVTSWDTAIKAEKSSNESLVKALHDQEHFNKKLNHKFLNHSDAGRSLQEMHRLGNSLKYRVEYYVSALSNKI
jgi:hypothetical protein